MQTIFNNADAWGEHLNALEKRDELLAFWQETIAQPSYSQEFVESTEMGVFLLELFEDLSLRKQFDTMLNLRNSIKMQQPTLYSTEFPYLDGQLIEYALYTKNDALFDDLMEMMAGTCCEHIDNFLPALRKTALYGKRTALIALCEETHDTIHNYEGFLWDVSREIRLYLMSDWGQTVYENYLQTSVFDHTAWQAHPLILYFNQESIANAFEVAFSGELHEMPEWNARFSAKGKTNFPSMMCYFYRYMHGKMPFCAAYSIWDLYLGFWNRKGKKAVSKAAGSYFRFTEREFEESCLNQSNFTMDYDCNVFAQMIGAYHTYDFLKVVGVVSSTEHAHLIKLVEQILHKYLAQWGDKSHFWKFGFVANWQKADSMPQDTYDRLLETLTSSFATLPALGEDDNTIRKNIDPFANFLKNILPTQGKGEDEHPLLKELRAKQSDDDDELIALPSGHEEQEPYIDKIDRLVAHADMVRGFPRLDPIVRTEPKIGRNDPCSCGSGKKYKKCCG